MKKAGKRNVNMFRKALAYISMFAMLLGLIEPAFVMKAEAASPITDYPVTINFYDTDFATPKVPTELPAVESGKGYHVVVTLRNQWGNDIGWGYADIDISKSSQTVHVTKFGKVPNDWSSTAWTAMAEEDWANVASAVTRLRYGDQISVTENTVSVPYSNISNQMDTFDKYKFLGTTSELTGATVNIGENDGSTDYKYVIQINFDKATSIAESDEVYVLATVMHHTGGNTYYREKLVTNGAVKKIEIPVTKGMWTDNNGNALANEEYNGSEKGASVKLVKGDGSTLNMNNTLSHTHCYDVVNGQDVIGCKVDYAGLTVSGSTHYDVINMTKIAPTKDYTFLTVLGDAVNYGVVSSSLRQSGHSETNMAVKTYDAGGSNLDPDLSGDGDTQVPGTFLIGKITGSNLRLGTATPATPVVITGADSISKITDESANVSVKVEMAEADINSEIDKMIDAMQDVSAEMLTHEATIYPVLSDGKLNIDTTGFDDGTTIYIDADNYLSAISSKDGVHITKKPNQVIVFNFRNTESVYIDEILVNSGDGDKNTDTKWGQFGDPYNDEADAIAQHVVWNLASAKTVDMHQAGGMFLVPQETATLKLGGTSCGWAICAGHTVLGESGEFHFVYRGMKSQATVQLNARKTVNGKSAAADQVFKFGIEKYDPDTKAFETVKVDDPENEGAKIPYILKNDSGSIAFPVTEMAEGRNVYRIFEWGKDDSTEGLFEYDTNSFYAVFNVTKNTSGGATLYLPGAVTYYSAATSTIDLNDGSLNGSVIAKSSVVFKNTTCSSFTLTKEVTGDPYLGTKSFKVMLHGVQSDNTTPLTGSYTVEGIEGKSTLTFTSGDSEVFYIKDNSSVYLAGLPVGTKITAEEIAGDIPEGFALQTTGAALTATVNAANTAQVTLVNKYTATKKGNLQIKKSVTGDIYDSDFNAAKKYPVTVTLDASGYYIAELYNKANSLQSTTHTYFEENVPVQFQLADGEYIVVKDIPTDVTYTVDEALTTADQSAGYRLDRVADADGKSAPSGKVKEDQTTELTVCNIYSAKGSLKVTKKVTGVGYDTNKEFDIKVAFGTAGVYQVTYRGETKNVSFTKDMPKTYKLKADESVLISEITVDTTYSVTETAPTDTAYAFGSFSGANTTGSGKIAKNTQAELNVNNTYSEAGGNLKITKTMEGTGYDADKTYEVKVAFNKTGMYDVKINGGSAVATSFTANTAIAYALKVNDYIEIEGIADGAVYTITETNLSDADTNAGYSKNGMSGDITNGKGTIEKNATKTVNVNNKYVKPDTGALKITKLMDGTGYDATKTYEIKVKFNKTGEYGVKTNGGAAVATVFTANTEATYNLKVNDFIEIEDIPAGTSYTVTETNLSTADQTAGYSKDGFSGDSTTGKGAIVKDATQTVNVLNKYEHVEVGGLKITKSMIGSGYDASKEYEIKVTFNKTGKYKVSANGAAAVESSFTAGTAVAYKLKAGEYVAFSEIPEGVTYTVAETDLSTADQTAGYSKAGLEGDVTAAGQGSIVKDTTKNVTVKNQYTAPEFGSLQITKAMSGTDGTGYNASKQYKVNVKFDKSGSYKVSVNNGAETAKSFTAGTAVDFNLKADDIVKISGIPAGTVYTVTETDLSAADKTAGYSKVDITGDVDADGKGTIAKDVTKSVSVNNKYEIVEIGNLQITKTMSGSGYDTTKEYEVNVSFSETGSYKVKINAGAETATTFTANTAKSYPVKVGDTILISGIPENVTYTVTESDLSDADVTAGYSKDGFAGNTNDGTGLIVRNSTQQVKVQNKYEKPETGSLQITKTMTGTGYDVNKTYAINVAFDKTGSYKVKINNGSESATAFTANTPVSYTVKAGDVIAITDVPKGVNYVVTETAPTGEGYSFDSFSGDTQDGTGTIVKDAVQAVNVNNRFEQTVIETGSLKITKKMTGIGFDANKSYEVKVTFNAGGMYDVSVNGAAPTATAFTGGKAWACQLKADETVEISNIPTGTTYAVAETALTDAEKALGYNNGTITPSNGSISTALSSVIVNNTYEAPKGTLNIKKVMAGDTSALNYDADKTYEVKVSFDTTGTYDVKQAGVTSAVAFGAGVQQSFALKAGETIEISNVPVGTNYTVEEAELSDPDKAAGYARGEITNKTGVIKVAPVTATVHNTYTKQTASLVLHKTVENPDNAPLPSSFKVAVRDEHDNYAQDTAGTFGAAEHYFDVSSGDAGEVSVTGLEVGQIYIIEEDEVHARVSGYDLDVSGDVSVKIKMVSGGRSANIINAYATKGTAPQKYSVTISKRAEGQTTELTGATLQLKSSDGTYETSWVSMETSRVLQLTAGTYTLTELDAPEGYAVADPITFTISSAGAVEIGGVTTGNTITMTDKLDQFDVNISKQAVGGGAELVNAKLEVKSADGGSFYESWISDGTVKTLKLQMGKYTLTETQAPNNYEIAESITFEVMADGKVVVDGKYVTANTVTMFDALKKKTVSLSKVDAFNSEEIAGANLVLYKVKADNTLEELTSWISSATEVYTFTLEAGDYAIKETVAPDGYELVESLVKFNLSFDANGTPVTTVTEGPGVYDAAADKISFKNDPIKVTGGLTIKVVDEVTGEDVPGAVVEVTEPDGTVKEYTTDDEGNVTNYKTGAVLGTYRVRVKSAPKGYTVTVNEDQNATVEANKVTEAIAKTNTKTGGLTILVLDKVTSAPVSNATVEVTEPDGSVKTYTTDSDGRVNKYLEKDERDHYTAALGTYKIKVTSVPEGYSVDTGIVGTETVVVSQVAEHIAKIVTKNETKPETKPTAKDDDDDDDDDDEETPANVPTANSGLQEETVTGTTKRSLTGGARRTVTESAMSLKTGESNAPHYLFGGSLAALFMGAAAYVMSKRKKEK